jgi:FMN reductase
VCWRVLGVVVFVIRRDVAPIKIVGLGGSSNLHESTMAALRLALAGAREQGAEVMEFDLYALDLPMYRYGVTVPEVEPFIEAVRGCQGMIWCSPLYHGTVPGSFKNALDWLELLSRDERPYLADKVVALVATAGGHQALQAINTMEFVVRALRGWTLPLTVPVAMADSAFDAEGAPYDPALGQRLRGLGGELVRAARLLSR